MKKEEVYDNEIFPTMEKIVKLCREHKIPIFCTFGLDEDPNMNNETLWCSTSLPISEKESDNKQIGKLYKVHYEGAEIVPQFLALTVKEN